METQNPCEVNPRAKRSSQSVKRVKREPWQPPQIPLSISWFGETKKAWKARCQSEAQPGSSNSFFFLHCRTSARHGRSTTGISM